MMFIETIHQRKIQNVKILRHFVYQSEVTDTQYNLDMCENNVLSTCKCATGQTKTVDAITVGPMGTPTGAMIGPHDITEICMTCKFKTEIFD